jgi:DNA-binding transcriptional ArsR family regulator
MDSIAIITQLAGLHYNFKTYLFTKTPGGGKMELTYEHIFRHGGIMADFDDVCEVQCFDSEKVTRVKRDSLSPEEILRLAETFKALSDGTRLKILHALSQEELCVCDLAEVVEMSQSLVSHQLRLLRTLRLVKYRKEGKMVYYSLDDDHIIHLFSEGLAHIRHK